MTLRDGDGSDVGGGAIYVYDSSLNVSNATFTNNTAGDRGAGGAILGPGNSTFTLSDLVVVGNYSGRRRRGYFRGTR